MTRKKITLLVFLTVFSLCSCVFPNDDHNPENGFFYKKGVSKIIAKGLTENTDLTLKIGYYPSGNYKTSQKTKEWATDFEEEFSQQSISTILIMMVQTLQNIDTKTLLWMVFYH